MGGIVPVILIIMSPILFTTGIGLFWQKLGLPFERQFINRLIMNVTGPCLVIDVLSKSGLAWGEMLPVIAGGLWAYVLLVVVGSAALYVLRKPVLSMLPLIMFGNMGNLGLPLSLYAFGETGLAIATILFVLNFIGQAIVGPLVMAQENNWRMIYRTPIIYAAVVGMLLIVTDIELPLMIGNSVNMVGMASIPLMLMSLGCAIGGLKVTRVLSVLPIALARIVGGGCAAYCAVWLLDIYGLAAMVMLLQYGTPTGVLTFAMADKYNAQPEVAAQTVVVSTLIFLFLALPAFLMMVRGGYIINP